MQVRVLYYYDTIVDETEQEKRQEQNSFFSIIRSMPLCTVRLGQLIKTEEGYRQKGVDILMAIDMLSKAYENQYDITILLAGDGDFRLSGSCERRW
ncbi:NYN domain-containing protein [Candidatus Bathyarchaeota archaeon]|nr:NYN domain-containing protein [Candidatus Bathyarchaeota archaeon]